MDGTQTRNAEVYTRHSQIPQPPSQTSAQSQSSSSREHQGLGGVPLLMLLSVRAGASVRTPAPFAGALSDLVSLLVDLAGLLAPPPHPAPPSPLPFVSRQDCPVCACVRRGWGVCGGDRGRVVMPTPFPHRGILLGSEGGISEVP